MLDISRSLIYALVVSTVFMAIPDVLEARAVSWAQRFPINQYTPEDIEILKQVMTEVLENGEDGVPAEWSNPDTGHGGAVTPLSSTMQEGRRCRMTRFRNYAETTDNVVEHFLCKQPDGVWAAEQPANP